MKCIHNKAFLVLVVAIRLYYLSMKSEHKDSFSFSFLCGVTGKKVDSIIAYLRGQSTKFPTSSLKSLPDFRNLARISGVYCFIFCFSHSLKLR